MYFNCIILERNIIKNTIVFESAYIINLINIHSLYTQDVLALGRVGDVCLQGDEHQEDVHAVQPE